MNTRSLIRTLSIVMVMMSLMFVPSPAQAPEPMASAGHTLHLQAPEFVHTAYAQEQPTAFDLGAYLDQEAGISAYFKSPDVITLSQVRSTFRTIEAETTDYIIGSVAVPNHPEHFDVHVYIHRTGWILAYYLRTDPVSKIVDVKSQSINTTKLRTVVLTVAAAAGVPFTDVTYYDFRYPSATHMLLVAEDQYNGTSFTISLPSTYAYFERSWADYDEYYQNFWFDGVAFPNQIWSESNMCYGTLTASQVLPDTPHTLTVDGNGYAYGVLVIVYRVP